MNETIKCWRNELLKSLNPKELVCKLKNDSYDWRWCMMGNNLAWFLDMFRLALHTLLST